MTSLEICAGAGGQAIGLEMAGFEHVALVELDPSACATLRLNRPHWKVLQQDLRGFDGTPYRGIDLLAGGVPCPPFSKAGKQLGDADERDLFPEAIRLVGEIKPKVVMLENVRGLMDAVFSDYRIKVETQLRAFGYTPDWHLLNASDYGVPQLRPRVVFLAYRNDILGDRPVPWPRPHVVPPPTVAEALGELMAARGWEGVAEWKRHANSVAPTLVGGSKKHGGPDLGPTRARRAWASLGVDGSTLADAPPLPGFTGMPKLTVQMAARIQGFPEDWKLAGGKTAAYRQVGNAFPPPVAAAVGRTIMQVLQQKSILQVA